MFPIIIKKSFQAFLRNTNGLFNCRVPFLSLHIARYIKTYNYMYIAIKCIYSIFVKCAVKYR